MKQEREPTGCQPGTPAASGQQEVREFQKLVLTRGGGAGILPTNVACRVGCRFCYEHFVKRDFANLDFRAIPRYTAESFDQFLQSLSNRNQEIHPTSVFDVSDGMLHMGPNADFFSLGLTPEQIDKVIESRSRERPVYLYTTGIDLDAALVARLTEKHGDRFVLRLSALTFSDEMKRLVVRNWTSGERLRQIIGAACRPRVMLMCFTAEQLIEDMRILNSLKSDGVRVLISIMHYSGSYPDDIKRLADRSYAQFPEAIRLLVRSRAEFPRITELLFLYPPEGYAWKFRHRLRGMLRGLGAGDAILCSGGAYPVIRHVAPSGARVADIPNPAGGSINFATTLTTRSVIERLRGLREAGEGFNRLIVPGSIWCVDGLHDLEAQTAESVRSAFPELEVQVMPIAAGMLDANLTLAECDDWYRVATALSGAGSQRGFADLRVPDNRRDLRPDGAYLDGRP
jgi:hypothetical protein